LKKDPIGNGIEIVKKNSENRVTTNGTQPPNGLPRNMTQPVVAIQRDSIRQNDSMPIIENKYLAPARSISRASFSRTRQQVSEINYKGIYVFKYPLSNGYPLFF